ncbi:MAG: hypothetical protein AAGI48_16510 [Verrucomicrobiota bacterium]
MPEVHMPAERNYGWPLKPTSSTHFEIVRKSNGQFCVVLNHSLLRGCTSAMIHWWFLHFPFLKVRLVDIEGYDETEIPAYYLWHPSDHYGANLKGPLGPGRTSQAGASIEIQETMQYLKYGWKYPVNSRLKIYYCASDGWAMGKQIPILGNAMMLRIHWRDVVEEGNTIGVHYHYEIVIGLGGSDPISRLLNRKITAHFSPEFFEAWHLHNAIEVGTFENFLPALYEQRGDAENLRYSRDMNKIQQNELPQVGFDRPLFERRVKGYKDARDAHSFQAWDQPSILDTSIKA